MATVISPVYSDRTGWVVGVIEDHKARPLTHAECEAFCAELTAYREAAAARAAAMLAPPVVDAEREALREALLEDRALLSFFNGMAQPAQVHGGPDDGRGAKVWAVCAATGDLRDALRALRKAAPGSV